LFDQCLELSQVLGDRMLQNEALRALGEISEADQQYFRAVDLYKQSLSIVQELRDITNISVLYFNVGRALQLAGENEKATSYFRDALAQSVQLGKKSGVLRALAGLGVVAAASGEAERAITLLMASKLIVAESGSSFPQNQAAWLTRHFELARAQLGEQQFANISAQAQMMPLNEAVKYALEEL